MPDVFQNVNTFFVDERIEEMPSFPEWNDDKIERARRELEELYEKRQGMLEEDPDDMETQYYWIGYVLRALGYCSSVSEPPPGGLESSEDRPDFTLFYSAEDFRRAVALRGRREFFASALGVMRVMGWDESLDSYESEDGTYSPAFDVDRHLRNTDTNWGVLTNGRVWRLYHRESSGLMNTYYEIDLIEALTAKDADAFKYFWLVFSPEGLGGSEVGGAIVQRLLN